MTAEEIDKLVAEATAIAEGLRRRPESLEIAAAIGLLGKLRSARQFAPLANLAESVSRAGKGSVRVRCLYAQALIELGKASAAIDMLDRFCHRLPRESPEFAEACGLLGRGWKQIYLDHVDRGEDAAQTALGAAINAYRIPFESDPDANYWHGINLAGLLGHAPHFGDPLEAARRVLAALDRVEADKRDAWWWATRAEAEFGLGDWDALETSLNHYVSAPDVTAFHIGGTLRQLIELWGIEADTGQDSGRGSALAEILRARLLQLSGGAIALSPREVRETLDKPEPSEAQLEAVLGDHGTNTLRWYRNGLDRATAVCSIRSADGRRFGTGWLVRAGSLGLEPADETLVVTNHHVVNAAGEHNALRPLSAEICFEAAPDAPSFGVTEIVWSSPANRHDCTVLRLNEAVTDITPLELAPYLPIVDNGRVYVIGYAGGNELQFSLQDNELLDLEKEPWPLEGVCRIHYRAPTEPGSSGSPVFDSDGWEVVALHHAGGNFGMPRLNGQDGYYAANEGISLISIVGAIRK